MNFDIATYIIYLYMTLLVAFLLNESNVTYNIMNDENAVDILSGF